MKNWQMIDFLEENIPEICKYIVIPDGMTKEDHDMQETLRFDFNLSQAMNDMVIYTNSNFAHERPLVIYTNYFLNMRETSYNSTSKSFVKRLKNILDLVSQIKENERNHEEYAIKEGEKLIPIMNEYQEHFGNGLFISFLKNTSDRFIALKIGESKYNVLLKEKLVDISDFSDYHDSTSEERLVPANIAIPFLKEVELLKLLK